MNASVFIYNAEKWGHSWGTTHQIFSAMQESARPGSPTAPLEPFQWAREYSHSFLSLPVRRSGEKLLRRAENLWPIFVLALLIFTSWKIYHAAWAFPCLYSSTFVDFTFEFMFGNFAVVSACRRFHQHKRREFIHFNKDGEVCLMELGLKYDFFEASSQIRCDFIELSENLLKLTWVRPSSQHCFHRLMSKSTHNVLPQPVIKLSVLLLCTASTSACRPSDISIRKQTKAGENMATRGGQFWAPEHVSRPLEMWTTSFSCFSHDTSCGAAQSRKTLNDSASKASGFVLLHVKLSRKLICIWYFPIHVMTKPRCWQSWRYIRPRNIHSLFTAQSTGRN